jgi:hypothetical protein
VTQDLGIRVRQTSHAPLAVCVAVVAALLTGLTGCGSAQQTESTTTSTVQVQDTTSETEDASSEDSSSSDDASADADGGTTESAELVSQTTSSGISYTGNADIANTEALQDLEELLAECEKNDITCSIALYDLDGGSASITYQNNEKVYSASAIKGPYCTFVYQDLIETGQASEDTLYPLIQNVINNSDNDDYESLRKKTYGMGWTDWLSRAGIDLTDREDDFEDHYYAQMSAEEFALAWEQGYAYLCSGTEESQRLADLFTETIQSPLHDQLGDQYTVWSKAGWYYDYEGNASPAMNDAGVVFSDDGTYVVAVLTSSAGDEEFVCQIVDALDRCHSALEG